MAEDILNTQFGRLNAQLMALDRLFISYLNQEHFTHSELLHAIHNHLKTIAVKTPAMGEGIERNDQIAKVHLLILEVLNKHYTSISSESFLNRFIDEFTIGANQYLENTPEILSIEYPLDSFKATDGDSFRVKTAYKFEAGLIKLQRLSRKTANFFRRRSRRKEKNTGNRIHRVHFRKLVQGYFFPVYVAQISKMVKEGRNHLMESCLGLFEFEHALRQNGYSIQAEGLSGFELNPINSDVSMPSGLLEEHRDKFEALLKRSGMKLSMNIWRDMERKYDFKKSREVLIRLNRSWQSTFFAFFEDWRFREQLFAYMQSVQSAHLKVVSIYSQRIKNSLMPEVEKQLENTSQLLGRLPDPDTADMEKIRSFFVTELYTLKKGKTSKQQQEYVRQAAEDIPRLLKKLENDLFEKLEIFPEKVGVVSNPDYISGVKPSEIYYFSPSEFIEFECIRDIQTGLAIQRTALGDELDTIINEFGEYDQIIDFYLDSTISMTEKPGMAENEILSFFRDGLQRLLKITHRISELLKGLQNETLDELSALFGKYIEKVAELDDNDNIINIYARLLKSRAIAESRIKRKKLADFSKKTYTRVEGALSGHTRWLRSSYSDLKKKLRLDTKPELISSHISNYLTQIQQRIYKLPLIYQHLFENVPIKEFNLFLSREAAIKILNTAYNDWLIYNFAATLVIGENGSGKSSLLYYYSKTLKSKYRILSFRVSEFYYTENDYFRLVREIFGQDNLADDQSIADFITSFKERRIVMIDGIERLFLRKVNGFTCLQKLLSLIVSTNHQIFWICSSAKYASVYLNKTIALSEHFDYSINIDSLNSQQLRDIVLKRNRLSGYYITYIMGSGVEVNAKTKHLTQVELEDKFFAELNEFAGSNISLSLNYWLQSIHSIGEEHVEIGDFITPDFGFLETISPEKAYTLLVVVMHGKISVEHHALIFNQKREKSYKILTILKEDSILVKQGEYFILNSILFRHVVRVLVNRNLIY